MDVLAALIASPVFWVGVVASLVGGFFAMSEGSFFKQAGGLAVIAALCLTILAALALVWRAFSWLGLLQAVVLFWVALVLGGRTLQRIIHR